MKSVYADDNVGEIVSFFRCLQLVVLGLFYMPVTKEKKMIKCETDSAIQLLEAKFNLIWAYLEIFAIFYNS